MYSDKVSFMASTEYQFALSSGFTRIHFLWYDFFHKTQNWLCYVRCLKFSRGLFPTEVKKTTTLGPCTCVCVLQTVYVSFNFQLFENCVDWMGRGIPFTSVPKRWQCWVLQWCAKTWQPLQSAFHIFFSFFCQVTAQLLTCHFCFIFSW